MLEMVSWALCRRNCRLFLEVPGLWSEFAGSRMFGRWTSDRLRCQGHMRHARMACYYVGTLAARMESLFPS